MNMFFPSTWYLNFIIIVKFLFIQSISQCEFFQTESYEKIQISFKSYISHRFTVEHHRKDINHFTQNKLEKNESNTRGIQHSQKPHEIIVVFYEKFVM